MSIFQIMIMIILSPIVLISGIISVGIIFYSFVFILKAIENL